MKKRKHASDWKALNPIPRNMAGCEYKQRPLDHRVLPLSEGEACEDSVYQKAEFAGVSAEMPRADVSGDDSGASTWKR